MATSSSPLRLSGLTPCGLAVLSALLTGCATPRPTDETVREQDARRPQRPNVLFLAVDDLRPELGCYGKDYAITPHMDRLAGSGIAFTRAYCQQAVCNPSRASVMTGLLPETLGVLDLRTDFRDAARPEAVTISEHFGKHGYTTWAIGKIFHNTLPDDRSWTEPKAYIDGYPFDPDAVYRAESNVLALEVRKQAIRAEGREKRFLDRFGEWYLKHSSTEAPKVADDAYFDGAQTDVAIDKLRELAAKDEPFFAAVGFYRPHLPFNAPKRYWDLYDAEDIPLPDDSGGVESAPTMAINNMRELRGYADFRDSFGQLSAPDIRRLRHGYLASVSYIDAQVGRLLDALEELELEDNTVVVLWSDHGWKLGERGSFGKMTNYEIDTRVPLLIRAPWMGVEDEASPGLTELVDVFPTLTELCALPTPEGLAGTSLVPRLRDPSAPGSEVARSVFLREGIWRGHDGRTWMGRAIRTDRYRYVEWNDVETPNVIAARELYNHFLDPREVRNLADSATHQPLVADLARKLRTTRGAVDPAGATTGNQ